MKNLKGFMKDLWLSLGLSKQDTVLIQANITNLCMKYKTKPKDILDSLLDSCGTLVFPTFMKDYNEWSQNGFDIRKTPSRMGILSETARQHPDSVRSGHPLFSFVALGCNRELFNVNNFSGYGKDSPFSIVRRLSGKIGVINLPNSQGNSIIHHAEELERVPYRKYRLFTGKYTDKHGEELERTYAFYGNGGYKTVLDPLDEILWGKGLYVGYRPYEGHGCRVIGANEIYNVVVDVIRQGKARGVLYEKA
jgi:aminoglycoside 3-N-acetyltransferase